MDRSCTGWCASSINGRIDLMTVLAIDSHVHIWNQLRGEDFIASRIFPVLAGKNFLMSDLKTVLHETKASQTVLVHGPASDSHTDYCLELADQNDEILSVIGWVDVKDSTSKARLETLSRANKFRGVRLTPMLSDNPKSYLTDGQTLEVVADIQERGQVIELLAGPDLLPSCDKIIQRVTETPIVIAHFGLPAADGRDFHEWEQVMKRMSLSANTYVKISGLSLVGGNLEDQLYAQTYISFLLDLFGPDRLLYASNWPVMTAQSTPQTWKSDLEIVLNTLQVSDMNIKKIFRDNALRCFTP